MGEKNSITIGVFADAHYADVERRNQRYYRESLPKVEECVRYFNSVKPDFVVHLGDLIDKGESVTADLFCLRRIEREYAKFRGERHYVLGNHDLETLSKEQFIANCAARKGYYSFDKGDFHFVNLDACYNEDGADYNAGNFDWTESYIPLVERDWLEADLRGTEKKTMVFVHQRLDDEDDPHVVKNARELREIMEGSGKVLAVFQGHDHGGAYKAINGIHYCTLPAVVRGSGLKNNAYALVKVRDDGYIMVKGFGKQRDRELPH